MRRFIAIASAVFFVSAAVAAGPSKTEFVSGDGFLRSSFGISVEFSIEASQRDPGSPDGLLAASFYSFPQHLFMTLESTELHSVEVDRRRGEVRGSATVSDARTDFEGVVEFHAIFEDLDGRGKNQSQNDAMIITVSLPTGAETFAGVIVPGGVDVGTRK